MKKLGISKGYWTDEIHDARCGKCKTNLLKKQYYSYLMSEYKTARHRRCIDCFKKEVKKLMKYNAYLDYEKKIVRQL